MVTNSPARGRIEWTHLVASGSQAESFLQGQLTQDLTGLAELPRWSLVLAPDSVVVGSCLVARDGADLVLSVERSLTNVVRHRLARFLLRTDCHLTVVEVETGPIADDKERVHAGWPGAPEFAAGLTPHSFGADFVRSTISFTKGCFTGQELVGRLDARGSNIPWRLVRASGPNRGRIQAVLTSKGPAGPQGLTTVITASDGVEGLGFMHRSLAKTAGEPMRFEDVLVTPID